MIPLGIPVNAVIKTIGSGRCVVTADDTDVPMNIWELPPKSKPGKEVEVFVYNDSKTSYKATRLRPLALIGEFAALKVKAVNDWGAFLEWGIPKDLFLPAREQSKPLHPGDKCVIRVILDHEKKGLIATTKLDSYFDYEPTNLNPGDTVPLLVYDELKIGFPVVVDTAYRGMLYRNEVFQELHTGESCSGVVKKLREDGRIDCSLQPVGFVSAAETIKDTLVTALKEHGGYLPLHDKSSPEDIAAVLKMSKKNFKKAAGILYKEGTVVIEQQGIRLV